MTCIYIIGAYYSPDDEQINRNIQAAKRAARRFVDLGYNVFCPHANYEMCADMEKTERAKILSMCIDSLYRCDMVAVLPSWVDSAGCKQEITAAVAERMVIIPVMK